jgi:hypothetical protein
MVPPRLPALGRLIASCLGAVREDPRGPFTACEPAPRLGLALAEPTRLKNHDERGNARFQIFVQVVQPPARKVLYRRGSISHVLSHGLSYRLSHDLPGWAPIVPPARKVVFGDLAKQTKGRYLGGEAAGLALLRGSSEP